MADSPNDGELIKRCVSGEDETSWEIFARKYSGLIWSSIKKTFHLYTFQNSKQDIEDIYSSVFLSLVEDDFRRLRQFRSKNACSLSTWLAVVTVRKTIDFIRGDKRHLAVDPLEGERELWEFLPDGRGAADKTLEEKQANVCLKKAVEALSPEDRAIYELLFEKGLASGAAAKAAGISVTALYTRKNRLVKKIKKSMQENGDGYV